MNRMLPLFAVPALLCSCEKIKDLAGAASGKSSEEVSFSGTGGVHRPLVKNLLEPDYRNFVNTPGALAVVNFGADWCGPCLRMKPVMESVAGEFRGRVVIGRVDVDASPKLAAGAGARSIPLVLLFRDGREVARFVGYREADALRDLFRTHTADLVDTTILPSGGEQLDKAVQPMKKDWVPEGMQKR